MNTIVARPGHKSRLRGKPKPTAQSCFSDSVVQALRESAAEEPFDPTDGGNTRYRSPLWTLARKVKGLKPHWTSERAWRRANAVVTKLGGWEQYGFSRFVKSDDGNGNADGYLDTMDPDDIQMDFINSFDQCRLPGDSDPLSAALLLAERDSIFRPLNDRASEGYPRFLKMCACIPKVMRKQAAECRFFLPCRKTAETLGKQPNTVGRWIEWAVQDGYLILTRPHSFQPRRAAEYRLCGELAARVG
jgi:hypothetical protein